jgi:hypothetical protein
VTCGRRSLIGVDGQEVAIYPLHCKRWRCRRCGARNLRKARNRIRAGLTGQLSFLTITSPSTESAEESFRLLSSRWRALHQRLNRRFGRLEFVAVVERQRRGHAHLHVLVRGAYVPKPWLQRAAADVGFGFADARRSDAKSAWYLTKSIGPGTSGDQLPSHFRRIRWSKGWSLPVARPPRRACQAWYLAFSGTVLAAESAKARGYRIVELVHGPPDRRLDIWPVRWLPLAAWCAR